MQNMKHLHDKKLINIRREYDLNQLITEDYQFKKGNYWSKIRISEGFNIP